MGIDRDNPGVPAQFYGKRINPARHGPGRVNGTFPVPGKEKTPAFRLEQPHDSFAAIKPDPSPGIGLKADLPGRIHPDEFFRGQTRMVHDPDSVKVRDRRDDLPATG
jgi:hypothetical protein